MWITLVSIAIIELQPFKFDEKQYIKLLKIY